MEQIIFEIQNIGLNRSTKGLANIELYEIESKTTNVMNSIRISLPNELARQYRIGDTFQLVKV